MKENRINDDDTPEMIEHKTLYAKLCADKKPYFFCYNYPSLKTEYDKFVKEAESNTISMYKKTFNELLDDYKNNAILSSEEHEFVERMHRWLPLDMSKSTMNRICWTVEKEFDNSHVLGDVSFDYSTLKSGNEYDEQTFEAVKCICNTYKSTLQIINKSAALDCHDEAYRKLMCVVDAVGENLFEQCPDEQMLCDILIDLCYGDKIAKQLMWNTCGYVIIQRLLERNNNTMSYPCKNPDGDFWCQGVCYSMRDVVIGGENIEGV